MSGSRTEPQASEYATRDLAAIGDTAREASYDDRGVTVSGPPIAVTPEPPAGSLEAALLAIRRAPRSASGWEDPWAGADDDI